MGIPDNTNYILAVYINLECTSVEIFELTNPGYIYIYISAAKPGGIKLWMTVSQREFADV